MSSTCPKCGKAFGSATALKQHFDAKSHYPYICDRCDKGFASQGATTQHLYDAHIDGKCQQDDRKQNDRQYQEARYRFPCDMCPRYFYSKEALRKHKSSPARMPSNRAPRLQANPIVQASSYQPPNIRKQIESTVRDTQLSKPAALEVVESSQRNPPVQKKGNPRFYMGGQLFASSESLGLRLNSTLYGPHKIDIPQKSISNDALNLKARRESPAPRRDTVGARLGMYPVMKPTPNPRGAAVRTGHSNRSEARPAAIATMASSATPSSGLGGFRIPQGNVGGTFAYKKNPWTLIHEFERPETLSALARHVHGIEDLRRQQSRSHTLNPEARPVPSRNNPAKRHAIALDTEMVGLADCLRKQLGCKSEPVLLTAIDFLTCEVLINTLILPVPRHYLKHVQWRTNVSGVDLQTITNALSLQEREPETKVIFAGGWLEARERLWEFMDGDTILVGQAIKNDLNALRMVHTRIVDCSILASNAVRDTLDQSFHDAVRDGWALKRLCYELMNIKIQEDRNPTQGHDCLEDTLAAREVVLCFLRHGKVLQAWAARIGEREVEKKLLLDRRRQLDEKRVTEGCYEDEYEDE